MENGTKLDLIVTHTNLFFPGVGNLTATIDLNQANEKLKGAKMTVEGNFVLLTIKARQYPIPLSNIALARVAK